MMKEGLTHSLSSWGNKKPTSLTRWSNSHMEYEYANAWHHVEMHMHWFCIVINIKMHQWWGCIPRDPSNSLSFYVRQFSRPWGVAGLPKCLSYQSIDIWRQCFQWHKSQANLGWDVCLQTVCDTCLSYYQSQHRNFACMHG